MFDNPNRELKRLEDRLLAAEKTREEEPERDEDPETALAEVKKILARDSRTESGRQPLSQNYVAKKKLEILQEEEERLSKVEEMRRSSTGGLVAALLLEIAALFAVAAWWILCR